VGNDDRINILKDNWIPGYLPRSFKPLETIPAYAIVKFLLNDLGTKWNMEVMTPKWRESIVVPFNKEKVVEPTRS
jgi:hypothetical protein